MALALRFCAAACEMRRAGACNAPVEELPVDARTPLGLVHVDGRGWGQSEGAPRGRRAPVAAGRGPVGLDDRSELFYDSKIKKTERHRSITHTHTEL